MANFCRNCGKQSEEGGAFCAACGMSLTTHSPAQAPPHGAEKKKVKIWIPIAAIVVVLALAFCGLFFFTDIFKSGDNGGPTVGGISTASPSMPPSETPSTSPTPESAPPATSTPEITPQETPTPESPPPETPAPETPSPELPPNHISAQFFDLVQNGVAFYLEYTQESKYLEDEYTGGFDSDDLWYHANHPHRWIFEEARQGNLCASTLTAFGLTTHNIVKDSVRYKLYLHHPELGETDWMEVFPEPPSTGGTISGTFGVHIRGGGVGYVGSGVGAINGVTMPYDIYDITLFGEATGIVHHVYLDGDTVSYMTVYVDGSLNSLYSFSEVSLTVPPDKMWLFEVPEDLPIR